MYGRSDQNALPHFARKLEDRVCDMGSGGFVKQAVFAFSRSDVDWIPACHGAYHIGVDTGGIDDGSALQRLSVGCDLVIAVLFCDGGNSIV